MPLRLLAACIMLLAFAAPAQAQHIICCMRLVDVKGNWIGASRDCAGGLKAATPDVRASACRHLATCEPARPYCPACDQEALKKARADRDRWFGVYQDQRKAYDFLNSEAHALVEQGDKMFTDYFVGQARGLVFQALGKKIEGTRWEHAPRAYDISNIEDRDAAMSEAADLLKDVSGKLKGGAWKGAGPVVTIIKMLMDLGFMNAKMLTLLRDFDRYAKEAQKTSAAMLDALGKARKAEDLVKQLEAQCRAAKPPSKPPAEAPSEDDEFKPTGQREYEAALRLMELWRQADGSYKTATTSFGDAQTALQHALAIIQSRRTSELSSPYQRVALVAQATDAERRAVEAGDFLSSGLERMARGIEAYRKLSATMRQIAGISKGLASCDLAATHCPALCDQAKIDPPKTRMSELDAALEPHRERHRESESKRHEARDRLWGGDSKAEPGSIAVFGKAGLDSVLLAGPAGGKAHGEVLMRYKELKEWSERAWTLAPDSGNVVAWADLGNDLLAMHAGEAFRSRSTAALRAALGHFQKTGNVPGAQNVYRQRWGNYGKLKDFKGGAEKFAGALNKLAALYEKSDELANDLQSWIDAFRDQKIGKDAEAKAHAETDKAKKQLDRLREACGIKPDKGKQSRVAAAAAAAPAPQFLEGPPSAAAAVPAPSALTVAAPEAMAEATLQAAQATLRAAQAALREVRALQQSLRALDASLGRQIVTPLSPWFAGAAHEAPPELLLALVKESRASLNGFEPTLNSLSDGTARAWRAVQAIPRDDGR